jgi:adenylosuccinate synthase
MDVDPVLLEGTQGTGLSLHHGFYPHVTSRDTTVSGCLAEAGIAALRVRRVLMVCRTYPIRVQSPKGATSGPMSKDLSWAEIARRSRLPLKKLLSSEKTSTTKRRRRVGEFDWDLLRKAASLNAPTDIALTFTDYISSTNRNARRFEQLTQETIRFVHEIERVAGAAVSLIATRFHSRSIIDRRAW